MKLSLTGLTIGFCLSAQMASATLLDLFCDDTTRMQDQLISVVGAERQGYGLRDPESMLEIWIVPESGDWTVVQNYANGTSCIMAIGEYWQDLLPEPA